jgi:hypothetical protein
VGDRHRERAFIADALEFFSASDHGDLGRDLRDHLGQLAASLTTTDSGAVFPRPSRPGTARPRGRGRFETEIIAPQRERDRAPFLRALQRGELATDTDIDLAIDQLAGPLYYRVLVTRQDAPPSFTETLVNRYLAQTRGHGPQGD